MRIRRWKHPRGWSDLETAVDEIYFLRSVLADEAAIIEAHLDYKTFPKTRRKYAEAQIARMRRMAAGEMWTATREKFDQGRALRSAGVDDCLSNKEWAESRGLVPEWVDSEPVTAPLAALRASGVAGGAGGDSEGSDGGER